MKYFLMIALSVLALNSHADVSQDDVNAMLDQMVAKKMISPEEGARARVRMKTMSPDQWTQLKAQGAKEAARYPASTSNTIEESGSGDLDHAQFEQIETDMSKIIPKSAN